MSTPAISTPAMSTPANQFKQDVEKLAAIAYFQHLISGYGNGEHPDYYQIVIQGKPKHYALEEAHRVLVGLLAHRFELDVPTPSAPATVASQTLRQLMVR